jgi:IS30 family transposase
MPAVRVMLMLSDREEISRGLAEGLQYKEIGLRLGRDSSVISRDVARHGGRVGYRAAGADAAACVGRERPKPYAVERSPRLRAVVCAQLRDGWSPASIAGRLPTEYASDQACRVSDVAARLGRTPTSLGPARNSLTKKGLVCAPELGHVAYAVPRMADFISRRPSG